MPRRSLFAATVIVLLANVAVIATDTATPVVTELDTLPAENVAAAPIAEGPPPTYVPSSTVAPTPVATRPARPPRVARAPEPHVVIGQIEIPKLGLNVPLNEGISLTSIDRGPSHWPGTAMPGRPNGNVVVAGHRVTHTRPFRHIDTLVPGDEIIFTVEGVRSVYAVTGNEVVTPDRTDIVNQTADPIVTLFACHPPGSARYRYVVRGALVTTA